MNLIEVKCEGTLLVLYINSVAKECHTMHSHDERAHLFRKAVGVLKGVFENTNRQRVLFGTSPVTWESYVAWVAGPNLRIWAIADGSRAYPYAWTDKELNYASP